MKDRRSLNNAVHVELLRKLFPQGRFISMHPALIWDCELKPTPLSRTYKIRVTYYNGERPVINVIGCKLSRGSSHKLPHVYSTDEQSLCLHLPPEKKWTPMTNIADTIVPWAAEWLYHYEIWVVTGEWNAGGTFH